MPDLRVDPLTRTVMIRGIQFPVGCIHAAMIETGGVVVADRELSKRLDRAAIEHRERTGKDPEMLFVPTEPTVSFIPKRITVHKGLTDTKGRKTGLYLYFAVTKKFHA